MAPGTRNQNDLFFLYHVFGKKVNPLKTFKICTVKSVKHLKKKTNKKTKSFTKKAWTMLFFMRLLSLRHINVMNLIKVAPICFTCHNLVSSCRWSLGQLPPCLPGYATVKILVYVQEGCLSDQTCNVKMRNNLRICFFNQTCKCIVLIHIVCRSDKVCKAPV